MTTSGSSKYDVAASQPYAAWKAVEASGVPASCHTLKPAHTTGVAVDSTSLRKLTGIGSL